MEVVHFVNLPFFWYNINIHAVNHLWSVKISAMVKRLHLLSTSLVFGPAKPLYNTSQHLPIHTHSHKISQHLPIHTLLAGGFYTHSHTDGTATYTPEALHATLAAAVRAHSRTGLSVNDSKTEALCQWSSEPPQEPPILSVPNYQLIIVPHFKCIKSTLSKDCSIDQDM